MLKSGTAEHVSSCTQKGSDLSPRQLPVCQFTGPFCTPVPSSGSCWFVDAVVFRPQQFSENHCYPLTALCSGAPVLLLNTILFSISTIHNLHTVASNIEQRDEAERSGGLLLMSGRCTLSQTPFFFFNSQQRCFHSVLEAPQSLFPLFLGVLGFFCFRFFTLTSTPSDFSCTWQWVNELLINKSSLEWISCFWLRLSQYDMKATLEIKETFCRWVVTNFLTHYSEWALTPCSVTVRWCFLM